MPTAINPWIAVSLIALGIGGSVLFAYFKIPEATLPLGVLTLGISILMARTHVQTVKEYTNLKNSIRPPSLVNKDELRSRE